MKERVTIVTLAAITCFSMWTTINQTSKLTDVIKNHTAKFAEVMISTEPDLVEKELPYKKLGKFELTWYCPCEKCVGKKKDVRTFTGTKPKQGRTIAVDPKKIPLGSIVYIQGYGYFIAEDIGGAIRGNHIDIFVNSHQEALENGKKVANIYLMQ